MLFCSVYNQVGDTLHHRNNKNHSVHNRMFTDHTTAFGFYVSNSYEQIKYMDLT